MVEKMRVEEDLRIATLEKKRLSDTERILLNTFDTLKKYYETKENETRNTQENQETRGEERIYCSICKFEATTKSLLNKHITDVHESKNCKCTKYDLEDSTEENLQRHIFNTHIDDDDFRCRKCKYEANKREDLSKHIADVHDIDIRQGRNGGVRDSSKHRTIFQESQTKEFCTYYWNRGYCKFGQKCFRTHEVTPYCYFQERCDRISTCRFFHEDSVNGFLDNQSNKKFYR